MLTKLDFYKNSRRNRWELLISFAVLIFTFNRLASFLVYNESRKGAVLSDPIIALFQPIDLTWLIFGILYTSVILIIIYIYRNPRIALLGLQTYTLMLWIRMLCMYLIPLNPPETTIVLTDPLVELLGTNGQILTKDLFFSGHTAAMFTFYLITENKKLKSAFLIGTVTVGIAVILQHVHYTIDVIAAPAFTYVAYTLRNKLRKD